jgi:3',5'-cyclic AMP phosphodiesterase CpdA
MRIAITSDLHYHPRWHEELERLAMHLTAQQPDLLVLAGDIGEPLNHFAEGLRVFQSVCKQRAALAGNHDVWHRSFPHTSRQLWAVLLRKAARLYGYHWLEQENLALGSLGVCGTMAWYDYGGRDPSLPYEVGDYEQLKALVSNDARYIDWVWTDREFAQMIGVEFESRLKMLQDDPLITDVVVITHVPLYRACLQEAIVPEISLTNAYYANVSLGETVRKYDKVRAVVSGHVHRGVSTSLPRENGQPPLVVYTIPADYGDPAAILLDTDTWEAVPIGASRQSWRWKSV